MEARWTPAVGFSQDILGLICGRTGAATKSTERFSLEMVEYLESKGHSPVYFPKVLRLDTASDTHMRTTGLLRQLTLQLLQRAQPADATPLAAPSPINTRDYWVTCSVFAVLLQASCTSWSASVFLWGTSQRWIPGETSFHAFFETSRLIVIMGL